MRAERRDEKATRVEISPATACVTKPASAPSQYTGAPGSGASVPATRPKAARRLVYPAGAPQAEVLPGHKLVRVAFGGTHTTDKPLVASLAIECGALVSIMAADTRIVNGQTLGSMLLALPEDEHAEAALEYIKNYPGITYEEVNG